MSAPLSEERWRRWGAAALIAGLGLAVSGCAMSRKDFARPTAGPVVLTGAAIGDAYGTGAEVRPAVMVEQGSWPGEPTTAAAAPLPLPRGPSNPPAVAAAGSPGVDNPPDEPKSKLLSPEEKARVIAELEALAKSQQATPAADKAKCDEQAAMALDPEERLKGDLADGKC